MSEQLTPFCNWRLVGAAFGQCAEWRLPPFRLAVAAFFFCALPGPLVFFVVVALAFAGPIVTVGLASGPGIGACRRKICYRPLSRCYSVRVKRRLKRPVMPWRYP
jgi:hypothetical protein